MRQVTLSIRVNAENPLHHLWRNGGVWWVHYTLHTPEGRIRRVRKSLGTGELSEALRARDHVLAVLCRQSAEEGSVPRCEPRNADATLPPSAEVQETVWRQAQELAHGLYTQRLVNDTGLEKTRPAVTALRHSSYIVEHN
jgi:hypothetical protein